MSYSRLSDVTAQALSSAASALGDAESHYDPVSVCAEDRPARGTISRRPMTKEKCYPTDPDPEKAASAVADLKSGKHGWKLHLNFDAGDPMVVREVCTFLKTMRATRYLQLQDREGRWQGCRRAR
jgi:hypothetical protein